MNEKEVKLFNEYNIKEDLFDKVYLSDNRDKIEFYLPPILEIEFVIKQKKTERFKEKWYTLITIYIDGTLQVLTEGVGNFVTNDQMNEILRVRDIIKKLDNI